jgi:hypothetical protein
VGTRVIDRCIGPGLEYWDLEIERTYYLPTYVSDPLLTVNLSKLPNM